MTDHSTGGLARFLSVPRLVGAGLVVALVTAMLLNTRFITPEELAATKPKQFDPEQTATELFDEARSKLPDQSKPLGEVTSAIQKRPAAEVAEELGAVRPNESSLIFPVSFNGTVVQASKSSLDVKVDGVAPQTTVLVPLTTAMNGSVVRDVMGFRFADAPSQSAFQSVANQIKERMGRAVTDSLGNPAQLKGSTVRVVGALPVIDNGAPQTPAKPVSIQPVSVEKESQ